MIEVIALPASGERLDKALTEWLLAQGRETSRSEVTRLFAQGRIRWQERDLIPKAGLKLEQPGHFILDWPKRDLVAHQAEAIDLEIVYEDEAMLVINKPRGLVVHPAPGHATGTLVQALIHHCGEQLSDLNGSNRPGIVHRIDKDTSGLLAVAKTNTAHRNLAQQLATHEMKRAYLAVVYGHFAERTGLIDAPIGRDPRNRQRMTVVDSGKPARTRFEVLQNLEGLTLLACQLETGRTHQIRVHLNFVGHPVVADPLYAKGRKTFGIEGQLLHAYGLDLMHPITGQPLHFEADPPSVMIDFVREQGGHLPIYG